MKDRWAKFMADKEWAAIKKQTAKYGKLVGEIQDRTLHLKPYSPSKEKLVGRIGLEPITN